MRESCASVVRDLGSYAGATRGRGEGGGSLTKTKMSGHPLMSADSCVFMYQGLLWISISILTAFNGIPWILMDMHGYPWIPDFSHRSHPPIAPTSPHSLSPTHPPLPNNFPPSHPPSHSLTYPPLPTSHAPAFPSAQPLTLLSLTPVRLFLFSFGDFEILPLLIP